jgi:perosamine synthetase
MKNKKTIQISQPVLGEEEWNACREPLFSGWVTQGPKVKEFEKKFAELHGVSYAHAVSNCTTALHLALLAVGVGEGDEVIVPAFTWVSTANAVLYCNAKPVFVDIDPHTFNLDVQKLAGKINAKTKAILPVHLFGLCADMDAIRKIAPGIPLVEDGACAAGAMYRGKMAGSLGDVGCFSFHPRKSITTGDGGMITTNNPEISQKVDMLRNHGASVSEEQRHKGPRPYILPEFSVMGFNYRMTDLQGAVGLIQVQKMNRFIEERNTWAQWYIKELKSVSWLRLPVYGDDYKHGWQSFVTLVDPQKAPMPRNDIMEKLQQAGISTRPGTHAVHMLEFYAKKYNLKPEDFPGAKLANDQSMAIPLHNRMSADDFAYVVETLKTI